MKIRIFENLNTWKLKFFENFGTKKIPNQLKFEFLKVSIFKNWDFQKLLLKKLWINERRNFWKIEFVPKNLDFLKFHSKDIQISGNLNSWQFEPFKIASFEQFSKILFEKNSDQWKMEFLKIWKHKNSNFPKFHPKKIQIS